MYTTITQEDIFMITIRQRISALFLVLTLLCAVLLGGCLPSSRKNKNPAATLAAPYEEVTAESYEAFDEKKIVARREFDRLTDRLFRESLSSNLIDQHFLVKNPAAYGITGDPPLYGTISRESALQDIADLKAIKEELAAIDINLLTDEQMLTARILLSYIQTGLKSEGLELYYQPLSDTIGIQAQLPILLCEYQFYDRQDVDRYLELVGGLDEYYAEILKYEQEQAAAGLMVNDNAIDAVIASCESYLLDPESNFMLDTFNERLEGVGGLSEAEKETYRQQNAALLKNDFIPAYQLLIDGMTALKGTSVCEGGICNQPEGKKYYEYLVASNTGTSYRSVTQMLNAMEGRLDKDLRTVAAISKSNPRLLEAADNCQFRQTDPVAMLEELKTLAGEDYPALPECNYTLKEIPEALELSLSPAFYLTPPIDDYQNNTIYINRNERFPENSYYTTLAHEGYPGHLYQNVYFRSHNKEPLRQVLPALGYKEGWATYVEYYSYTVDNGLPAGMGELLAANMAAKLGLQACLDIYINYQGWTRKQVADYLSNFYQDSEELASDIYDAMIKNPTNFLSYYVGFLEFQNMRELAEAQLGTGFNAKEFHTFLLELGPAPFDVIQPYFTAWLMSKKS